MDNEQQASKNIGQHYADLLNTFTAVCAEHAARLDALRAMEMEIAGTDKWMLCIAEDDHQKELRTAKERVFSNLISIAEKRFAPPGGHLKIDRYDLEEKLSLRTRETDIDPLAIWTYLEATYGAGHGVEEGYRQIAAEIVYKFRLNKNNHIERKGGYTVLNLEYIYIDSIDKKYSGKNKLAYNCSEGVSTVFQHLAAFATWAGYASLSSDLMGQAHKWCRSHSSELVSRERFTLGDGAQVVLITYLNRFEFRLRDDVAEQLQIFIATYGAQALAKAA